MQPFNPRSERLAILGKTIIRVFVPASLVLGAIAGISHLTDIGATNLLRDPAAVLGAPWYAGAISTFGVALWAVSAGMCLLALVAARPAFGPRTLLTAGAAVSILLGVDDALLLHESALPLLGIPSPVTIGLYGVVAIVLFARTRQFIANRPDVGVFLLAIGLFAISVGIDGAHDIGLPTPPASSVIEDLAKYAGIVIWTVFFGQVSADVIREVGEGRKDANDTPSDGRPIVGEPGEHLLRSR